MNKFDTSVQPYLVGKSFSNGLDVKVAPTQQVKDIIMRIDLLEAVVRGKNVLHVGFADHLPLIKQKIQKNNWLHKRLMDASARCFGIDIDEELVRYVETEIGIKDVMQLDIVGDEVPGILKSSVWDYMVIGEVLEHIDNPVHFLQTILSKYQFLVKQIVVTVPNAHDLLNLRNIRKGVECINTDHRYWFTPYTLAKVGTRAGLRVHSFVYTQSYLPGSFISRTLIHKFPMLRESVVMIFDVIGKE